MSTEERDTTLVVLVRLKPGVEAEAYERFIRDNYAPVVRALPSVRDWCGYRLGEVLGGGEAAPYSHVVVVPLSGMDDFGRDLARAEVRALLGRLSEYVELWSIVSERFV